MDPADDERIKRLSDQIQQERNREKVLQLSRELIGLLDAKRGQPRTVESEEGYLDPSPNADLLPRLQVSMSPPIRVTLRVQPFPVPWVVEYSERVFRHS
jgi:hypothetical protein